VCDDIAYLEDRLTCRAIACNLAFGAELGASSKAHDACVLGREHRHDGDDEVGVLFDERLRYGKMFEDLRTEAKLK
jgi:hypothetical protein